MQVDKQYTFILAQIPIAVRGMPGLGRKIWNDERRPTHTRHRVKESRASAPENRQVLGTHQLPLRFVACQARLQTGTVAYNINGKNAEESCLVLKRRTTV